MRINVVTPCNFILPKVCKSCVWRFGSDIWSLGGHCLCELGRRQCSQWEEFVWDSFGCLHLRQPCHVTSHPPDRKFFWAIGQILLELHQFHRCHQKVKQLLYLFELLGQQVFNRIFKRGSYVFVCMFVFLHIHCNHPIACVHCKMQKVLLDLAAL